jgi:type III restriction enzyme
LKEFHPLLTLRYSATPREYYNLIYRLDAMDAYNKKLVKKISVKGITESGTTATTSFVYLEGLNLSKSAPTATIQFDCMGKTGPRPVSRNVTEGYNLFDNSGELPGYRDGFVVKRIDGRDDSMNFLNGVNVCRYVIGKVDENSATPDSDTGNYSFSYSKGTRAVQ